MSKNLTIRGRMALTLETYAEARQHKDGLAMIAAERARQIEAEGFHDDGPFGMGLFKAAKCYKLTMGRKVPPSDWPWSRTWWKPTTAIRNLVKAGALFVAHADACKRHGIGEPEQAMVRARECAEAIDKLLEEANA